MRRVLIVGAGQSGLQLGHLLLAEGYHVTIMSARTPDEIRDGWPTSTQAMFHVALETERRYGLDLWSAYTPQVTGLRLGLSEQPGVLATALDVPLEHPAQSTDQRLKMAAWLELFEDRGGVVHYQGVTTSDLDGLVALRRYDLVVVAAGKGDLAGLFDRDPARSRFDRPQRGLAVAYVHGLAPDPARLAPHIELTVLPGLGELFVIPSLTRSGPCDILFWEAVPGGPLDVIRERLDPAEHLRRILDLARRYAPWVYERAGQVELAGPRATLAGRFTPTVRYPVAHLPSGGITLGMADTLVANDPVTSQGSNTAAKCADAYLRAILARGEEPFDGEWMTATFEGFWAETAAAVTGWTNAALEHPDRLGRLLTEAAGDESLARRLAGGFSDPNTVVDWYAAPDLFTHAPC